MPGRQHVGTQSIGMPRSCHEWFVNLGPRTGRSTASPDATTYLDSCPVLERFARCPRGEVVILTPTGRGGPADVLASLVQGDRGGWLTARCSFGGRKRNAGVESGRTNAGLLVVQQIEVSPMRGDDRYVTLTSGEPRSRYPRVRSLTFEWVEGVVSR